MCLLGVVAGEFREGDGDAAQTIQTLHRRGDDHHPPPDGLALHDLRPSLPGVGVERVQPGGAQGQWVSLM